MKFSTRATAQMRVRLSVPDTTFTTVSLGSKAFQDLDFESVKFSTVEGAPLCSPRRDPAENAVEIGEVMVPEHDEPEPVENAPEHDTPEPAEDVVEIGEAMVQEHDKPEPAEHVPE